jgi:hypothetical protein
MNDSITDQIPNIFEYKNESKENLTLYDLEGINSNP